MELRYRYKDGISEDGVELILMEYAEVKKTPCGAWVQDHFRGSVGGKKRFVLDGTGRRLCYKTKELAWKSYIIRKKRQQALAKHSLEIAEYMLSKINNIESAPEQSVTFGKPALWFNYIFD